MTIVELVIDEEAEVYGIEAISLVEQPAIEADFVAFAEQQKQTFAQVDEDERILLGPALIPDKPIFRRSDDEEYYVYFSKSTVKQAMQLFLMAGNQGRTTLDHNFPLQGLSVVESWLIEDPEKDKSNSYGMTYPKGTWMVAVKVNNDAIWQNFVKEGKVKGFSIEGYFVDRMALKEKATEMQEDLLEELANTFITDDKTALQSFNDYPDSVRNNAKRGIEMNERVNNRCATQVGKVRAQQLADGKPISITTIKRMWGYLNRAEAYYDPSDSKACGTISYLLWGGKAAKNWSRGKLRELDMLQAMEDELVAELATIGPRGGVKPSRKAPKSGTPNRNPKRGSSKNKPGAASNTRGVKVPAAVEKSLQKKADEFNERYKKKLGYGVTIGQLRTVYQRGVGAFQTSHSPNVSSSQQWGQARVNAYLYLVKNGRPQNKKYTGDYDLLPKGHPKSDKK
jgi:hypothetical protein